MHNFSFVHALSKKGEQNQHSLSSHSLNIGRAFQDTPNSPVREEEMTRLIDDNLVPVCLLLGNVGACLTINGEEVGYPPPGGKSKSEIKRRILSATVKIPFEDRKDLPVKPIKGYSYTEAVEMVRRGKVYRPIDSTGSVIPGYLYSDTKGWSKC